MLHLASFPPSTLSLSPPLLPLHVPSLCPPLGHTPPTESRVKLKLYFSYFGPWNHLKAMISYVTKSSMFLNPLVSQKLMYMCTCVRVWTVKSFCPLWRGCVYFSPPSCLLPPSSFSTRYAHFSAYPLHLFATPQPPHLTCSFPLSPPAIRASKCSCGTASSCEYSGV